MLGALVIGFCQNLKCYLSKAVLAITSEISLLWFSDCPWTTCFSLPHLTDEKGIRLG